MSLLDSIYMGYPVGSLLLWSTKQALKHERDVGGFKLPVTPEDYPVNYLLDGQQRLTTLYGVFHSDAATERPELAKRFNVCFIPGEDRFVHASVAPEMSINMRNILDTTKLLPELARFSTEDRAKIAVVTERFKDYEFPVVTIKDRSNQEVCRIFQRINSSGTSLGTSELLAAWTWSDEFDLRNEIIGLLDKLGDKGFEGVGEALIMRCLSSIVSGGIEAEALVDEDPARLVKGMVTVKQAFFAATDFLESEFKIRNFVFLPFPIMMVPLVRFFAFNLKPNATQRAVLKRWFWNCCFSLRYRAGTNSAVMDDLQLMRDLFEGKDVTASLNTSVEASYFLRTWRINSTAAKAAICLLAQCGPRSFLTGAPVDLGATLSAYNSRQFHHIYPKAYLGTLGISFHTANVIANICLLTASDNNTISDASPEEYLGKIDAGLRSDVLKAALIPEEFADGAKPYAAFVDARATVLAAAATALVSGKPIVL